ncbi:unnamed protein product [Psylliodes chrysocephalus]|uniref:Gustatory receptor n=1 Tax=Psylliodes chrysocephalus TaxID=3402493 RepID=A0A9P0GK50_9CUCU|nr:unnamed protein product [Psylliodes chrysocephala]
MSIKKTRVIFVEKLFQNKDSYVIPRKPNIDFKLLTFYLKAGKFFGATYYFMRRKRRNNKCNEFRFKIVGVILSILAIMCYLISQGKYVRTKHPAMIAVDVIWRISSTIFLLYYIFSLLFSRKKYWLKLYDKMFALENILNTCETFERNHWWLISLKIAVICFFIPVLGLGWYVSNFISKGNVVKALVFLRSANIVYKILISLYYVLLANWLEYRYKSMAEYLKLVVDKYYKFVVIRKIAVSLKLADSIVKITNNLYGGILFLNFIVSIVQILVNISAALDYSDAGTREVVLFCMSSVCNLIVMVLVTMSCDAVDKASNQLSKTCYWLHEIIDDQEVKNKLLVLVKYEEEWRPIFSAGGFFNVNQSCLTTFFSSIITYLVLIVQYNMGNN